MRSTRKIWSISHCEQTRVFFRGTICCFKNSTSMSSVLKQSATITARWWLPQAMRKMWILNDREMTENRKGEWTPFIRCAKKGCETMRSVWHGNASLPFFPYTDVINRLNSNLTLYKIIELAYLFVIEIPLKRAVALTGRSFRFFDGGSLIRTTVADSAEKEFFNRKIYSIKLYKRDASKRFRNIHYRTKHNRRLLFIM